MGLICCKEPENNNEKVDFTINYEESPISSPDVIDSFNVYYPYNTVYYHDLEDNKIDGIICNYCRGSGKNSQICYTCKGSGIFYRYQFQEYCFCQKLCLNCKGRGKISIH